MKKWNEETIGCPPCSERRKEFLCDIRGRELRFDVLQSSVPYTPDSKLYKFSAEGQWSRVKYVPLSPKHTSSEENTVLVYVPVSPNCFHL